MSKDYSNNFLVCLKSATDKRLPLIATYRLLTHNLLHKRRRANFIIRSSFYKFNVQIFEMIKMAMDAMQIAKVIFLISLSFRESRRTVKNFTTEARRTQRGRGERRFYISLPFFGSAILCVLCASVVVFIFRFTATKQALSNLLMFVA